MTNRSVLVKRSGENGDKCVTVAMQTVKHKEGLGRARYQTDGDREWDKDELFPFHFEAKRNGLLILRSEGSTTKRTTTRRKHPYHFALE